MFHVVGVETGACRCIPGKDRKKGNDSLRRERNDRRSILHEIFKTTSYYTRSSVYTRTRMCIHARIQSLETKYVLLYLVLVWSLEYIPTIPSNLEPSSRFCQSKLLRGNGSVGWSRYASHACTSNTIVLSGRLAEYYRSWASIIIFRKFSDWIRSDSPFDIESSANFPLPRSASIQCDDQ